MSHQEGLKCYDIALHCRITPSRPRPANSVDHLLSPVFHEIRNVSNGIAVREQIPTAGSIPVIVQPASENQVRCCADK